MENAVGISLKLHALDETSGIEDQHDKATRNHTRGQCWGAQTDKHCLEREINSCHSWLENAVEISLRLYVLDET